MVVVYLDFGFFFNLEKANLFLVLLAALLFAAKTHLLQGVLIGRLATQGGRAQQGHFNGRLAPVVAVIAFTRCASRLDLVFRQARQYAKDDGHSCGKAGIHDSLADRVGNVLEMHGIALDQDTGADNGVDSPGHGQELCCQGQFKGSRHGGFKHVIVVHLAFLQGILNARYQIANVLFVPSRLDNANAHGRAIEAVVKTDFGFGSLRVVRVLKSSEAVKW